MRKPNEKNKVKANYETPMLLILAGLIFIYCLIYLYFKGNGWFSVGVNLEKADWLSFFGNYLSFSGTILVSAIALFQSKYYAKANKEENKANRIEEIQPILSIIITERNSQVKGTAVPFTVDNPRPKINHRNFTLGLENVGLYPVKHVIVFDRYLFHLLKCNCYQEIQVAYEDSPDCAYKSKSLLIIKQSNYERDDRELPKKFTIVYEDIDGSNMSQIFELKILDETFYYALQEIRNIPKTLPEEAKEFTKIN